MAGTEARIEHAQWPERLHRGAARARSARSQELADALAPLAGDGQGAFARLRERLEEGDRRGSRALTAEQVEGGVRWAETGARNVSCHYAPVDVAAQLAALLEAQSCAWMLTSATLAVGEDFSHYKRRSGLAQRAQRALREPVRLRQPGIAVPAQGPRRSRARRATRAPWCRPRCRCSRRAAAAPSCCSPATARCARRPRNCAGPGATRRRCRCWCRATARATSCCGASARPATPCCSAPAASGKAWT